ncbi:MAG: hypothetical protein AAGE52_02425 [Myxococcota bacterium]
MTQTALAEPLVLHPEAGLERLGQRTVRALTRRGLDVEVGEAPPVIAEAVAEGHVALVQREDALWVGVGGPHGRTLATTLVLDPRDPGADRAVALAVESLLDEASLALPPAQRQAESDWVYLEYPEERREREGARPTIYLRMLLGYSPVRERVLIGPGAGLGLCVGAHCLTIEADLPLMPEEVQLRTGERIKYRAVSTSVRAQLRPLVVGDVSFGITLGLLSRIGSASLVGGDARQTVHSFGFRGSFEVSWRIAGPLEWVFEAGADAILANSRARALVHGQFVVLEDTWTPWVITSLRIRPEPEPDPSGRDS